MDADAMQPLTDRQRLINHMRYKVIEANMQAGCVMYVLDTNFPISASVGLIMNEMGAEDDYLSVIEAHGLFSLMVAEYPSAFTGLTQAKALVSAYFTLPR